MKLVIMGAPGAGKGTQSKLLTQAFNLAYISTGDMLREEIKSQTEIGKKVEHILQSGALVSDDLMIEIVRHRLNKEDCNHGFLLDGFPRTQNQAQQLELISGKLDRAIYIFVPDELLIERIANREICKSCGAIYNVKTHSSRQKGICDICGGPLYKRPDDTLEAVKIRLKKYKEETKPLIHYFQEQQILLTINGVGDSKQISQLIVESLS